MNIYNTTRKAAKSKHTPAVVPKMHHIPAHPSSSSASSGSPLDKSWRAWICKYVYICMYVYSLWCTVFICSIAGKKQSKVRGDPKKKQMAQQKSTISSVLTQPSPDVCEVSLTTIAGGLTLTGWHACISFSLSNDCTTQSYPKLQLNTHKLDI